MKLLLGKRQPWILAGIVMLSSVLLLWQGSAISGRRIATQSSADVTASVTARAAFGEQTASAPADVAAADPASAGALARSAPRVSFLGPDNGDRPHPVMFDPINPLRIRNLMKSGDYTTDSNTQIMLFFDEAFGGNLYDSSNYHHTVTNVNNVTFGSPSAATGDAQYAAVGTGSSYLSVNGADGLGTMSPGANAFVLDFWIRPTSFPTNPTYLVQLGSNNYGFTLQSGTTGSLTFVFGGSSGAASFAMGTLSKNVWTHVTVARTSGGTFYAYLNGVQTGTDTANAWRTVNLSSNKIFGVGGQTNQVVASFDNVRYTVGSLVDFNFPTLPHANNIPTIAQVTPVTTPTADATPNYTFTTNVAGSITYGGDCAGSSPSEAVVGNNTVTLAGPYGVNLGDGVHSNCTITVGGSNTLSVTSFTVDTTGPVVTQKVAVPSPTKTTKPNYTFTVTGLRSGETGTVTYAGGCKASLATISGTGSAVDKLVQLTNASGGDLVDGTYASCTITVKDALSNASTPLTINAPNGFIVDTSAPALSETQAVHTPTNDSRPSYTVTVTGLRDGEQATIQRVSGSCYPSVSSVTGTASASVAATFDLNSNIGGDLPDGQYSDCVLSVTDAAGNTSSSLSVAPFSIDAQAPVISEVTPAPSLGSSAHPVVTIGISGIYEEAAGLVVSGSCSSATTSFSGPVSSLQFALSASGGGGLAEGTYSDCLVTVTDAAGNSSNVLALSPFTVDLTAPQVWNVYSSLDDGTYGTGVVITVRVRFSETVVVSTAGGTPSLELETGTVNRAALYASGSGTNELTFNYAVSEGDQASDLDYVGTTSLSAGGGSLSDAAGNPAAVALVAPGAEGSLGFNNNLAIDTVLPVLAEVTPIANPVEDATPDYTFSSTKDGSITYGGSCTSLTTTAVAGDNTVTFEHLDDAYYDDCTIRVTDAFGNVSAALAVSPFEVLTVALPVSRAPVMDTISASPSSPLINQAITVTGTAHDGGTNGDLVSRIELYVAGTLVGSCDFAPAVASASCSQAIGTRPLGTYALRGVVIDSEGASAARTGSVTTERVNPTFTTEATVTPEPLRVVDDAVFTATAADLDGEGVASMEVRLDGTLVRSCSFSPALAIGATCSYYAGRLARGPHTVIITATDSFGGVTNSVKAFKSAASTLTSRLVLSTLRAGALANFDLYFTLAGTDSGLLTVTFPDDFQVLTDADPAQSSACLSGFSHDAHHLYATKTNCPAAEVQLRGATVENPPEAGPYTIRWTNDLGEGQVIIVSSDSIDVYATVDPFVTFNVGAQAAAEACNASFSGDGGTVSLGSLTPGTVASSDVDGVPHICTRLTSNATNGAVVTVRSLNGNLHSQSVPTDLIPSTMAPLMIDQPNYGLCFSTVIGESGNGSPYNPTPFQPLPAAPFGVPCSSLEHNIGPLTTDDQPIWTVSGTTVDAFAKLYVKAAVSRTQPAHNDYFDQLTFVASSAF